MKDVDLTGFLYSADPVNERVKLSLEWNRKKSNREVFVPGTDYTLLIAGDTEIGGTSQPRYVNCQGKQTRCCRLCDCRRYYKRGS